MEAQICSRSIDRFIVCCSNHVPQCQFGAQGFGTVPKCHPSKDGPVFAHNCHLITWLQPHAPFCLCRVQLRRFNITSPVSNLLRAGASGSTGAGTSSFTWQSWEWAQCFFDVICRRFCHVLSVIVRWSRGWQNHQRSSQVSFITFFLSVAGHVIQVMKIWLAWYLLTSAL